MARALTPRSRTRELPSWDRPSLWFDSFRREMDGLLEQFFGGEDGGRRMMVPPADIAETEQGYEVTMDLPGLKPEDVDVELQAGQLIITGRREHEEEEKGKTFQRLERSYGQFRRALPLETDVDPEKIQAEYKNGVLRISLVKTEAARPKKITVKS